MKFIYQLFLNYFLINIHSYAERQDGDPSNHSVVTRPTPKTDDGLGNFVPHDTSKPAQNKLMDRDLGSHSEIIFNISTVKMKKKYFNIMFVSIAILTYTCLQYDYFSAIDILLYTIF